MSKLHIYLFLILTAFVSTLASAQSGQKSSFDNAINEINCATVKFIHREQGRAESATNIECSSYEGIKATIPQDEKGTTAILAAKIESYKNKYVDSKELGTQIDVVIKYAYDNISRKQRKNSVDEFKNELAQIRSSAISSINNTALPPNSTLPEGEVTAADTNFESTEVDAEQKGGSSNGMVGWLALLISIAALGLSVLNFLKGRKLSTNSDKPNQGGLSQQDKLEISRGSKMAQTAMEMVRALEQEVHKDQYTPKTTEPTWAIDVNNPKNDASKPTEPDVTDDEPEQSNFSISLKKPANEEPMYEVDNIAAPIESIYMENTQPMAAINSIEEIETHDTPTAPAHNNYTEDGENKPYYRYAPAHPNGSINEAELSNEPSPNSVYELEMFPQNPDRAFFYLLSYPEVIKKAIKEPEVYLQAYCDYSTDPQNSRTIYILEEGIMKKSADNWQVFQKSKISFQDPA
ncbi:MAG: hypothetical protein SGJ04_02290 [Bacteroidota bacterium]|nr:hypothetical protein [Bacteroidota bacterium]